MTLKEHRAVCSQVGLCDTLQGANILEKHGGIQANSYLEQEQKKNSDLKNVPAVQQTLHCGSCETIALHCLQFSKLSNAHVAPCHCGRLMYPDAWVPVVFNGTVLSL